MKFYEIDTALQKAVSAADKPVCLKIAVAKPYGIENIFEQDIVEADFYSLKEAAGGITARGEVLLDNPNGCYNFSDVLPGNEVTVSFSVGAGLPYFKRFVFYLDEKGVQHILGPGHKRFVRLSLRDFSANLRKTGEARDWSSPAVFTYSVVCDTTQPEKSLVHGIAQRAELTAADIDCSTIPATLPYVRLKKNMWAELSSIAMAYRCHLECTPEKALVFCHSPYQTESFEDEGISYTFSGENIFYLRKTERNDLYRNSIRLKINLPVALAKQEIWRYDDPPVLYDAFLQAHYPFTYPLERAIENEKYEARYRIIENGGERAVVYADDLDTKEEAENRLDYDGGPFSYSQYDVATHHDKALLALHKDADGDLYTASIFGRPIVVDLNRSCFMTDRNEAAVNGAAVLNVTGQYFSDCLVNGKPHYEDWVSRELAERCQKKREFTVKTHKGIFNARVGAKVQIITAKEWLKGTVNAFHLRYRKNEAFVTTFRITEKST